MLRLIIRFVYALIAFTSIAYASDSLIIQTFSFDSLYKRNGVFRFPDKTNNFRKILMEYRLKCDPKTAHDKYNCGEWDYLTYNVVRKHTGIYDSVLSKGNLLYKLNYNNFDTIRFSKNQPYNRVITIKPKRNITKLNSDSLIIDVNKGSKFYKINQSKSRFQIYYNKNELKALGINKGSFNRLGLYFNNDVSLLNLTIKAANYTIQNQQRFINPNEVTFDVLYDNRYNTTDGLNKITLNKPLDWNGFTGLLLDISIEKPLDKPLPISGIDSSQFIFSEGGDNYLKFDGENDQVYVGSIPELNGTSQFTFETWLKIDSWKNWAQIFGNGKTQIELGDAIGDIYCEIRPVVNSYAYIKGALKLGVWSHIAFTYDGTKKENKDKIKFYLNGEQLTLSFSKAQLPEKTANDNSYFSFSNLNNKNNAFNGCLKETRIWNYTKNENEIKDNFLLSLNNINYSKQNLIYYCSPELSDNIYELNDKFSNTNYKGVLIGVPQFLEANSDELILNQKLEKFRPQITFFKSDFTSEIENISYEKNSPIEPKTLIKYKVQNYKLIPDEFTYVFDNPQSYTIEINNDNKAIIKDSMKLNLDQTIINTKFDYYQAPYEKIDEFEIGRFITPYGINLELGPDGFCWTYDVTDYADLLQGDVELSMGNQQELLDVKFIFIKGTPPRSIIKRDKIWNNYSDYITYSELSNDKKLSEKWLKIHPDAKQFKIKTRITGHGHQSNNGNAPHCCEWKDNTHYLYVNNEEVAHWHIWQTFDCGTNPVFPQGGTWPHAREGWCPGDVVKDNDFEITNLVKKDSILIDYDITPVPSDNLGMGNGNYVMNFELLQYGNNNFNNDAEIYDVIAPSNQQYYSRKNPICSPPIIKVRNNGNQEINSMKINYHVSGGEVLTYEFVRKAGIKPHSIEIIELPLSDASFWLGDGKNFFYVTITEVNGKKDDYADNDTYISSFNMPDILPKNSIVVTQSNLRGSDFSFKIYDLKGNKILDRPQLYNSYTYNDTLKLPEGCYTIEIYDTYGYGLSYWAFTQQGNGSFRIIDNKGKLIKNFNPDFGFGIKYSFYIGDFAHIEDNNFNSLIKIYPNPAKNYINLKADYDFGFSEINLTDINGNIIKRNRAYLKIGSEIKMDLDNYPSGLYYLNIKSDYIIINQKFIKE